MTSVIAVLISLLFMGFFIFLFVFSYRFAGEGRLPSSRYLSSGKRVAVQLLFIVLGFLLCWYLVSQNRFVYYWDYGGYWQSSCSTMKSLFQDPMGTVKSVYLTILENDYNNLLPLLVSLPLRCVGYSFTRYVLLNYLLFLAPVWVILVSILWKLLSPAQGDGHAGGCCGSCLFIVFAVATYTPLYCAMLHGYIDIACLVPATLAVYLFVDYDCLSFDRRQIVRDLLISTLLLTCFLFRRYFAFFVVGYGAALILLSGAKYMAVRKREGHKAGRNILLNLGVVIGFASVILLVLFRRLVERILVNNYSNQYEAYDAELLIKLGQAVVRIGVPFVALACIAIVLSLSTGMLKKMTLFCSCSAAVTMFAFFRVQSMGEQHIYTVAGSFLVLAIIGVYLLTALIKANAMKASVGAIVSIIVGVGAAYCFVPAARLLCPGPSWLYPQQYDPLQRDDIDQLHSLVGYLNELTAGTDDGVYVVSGSSILNDSVLASVDLPYNDLAVNNLYWSAQVDLRDGFRTSFFDSTYIVTTDSCQLGLKAGTQEVITFLWQEIHDQDSPVGRHFVKLGRSFKLDDGVTAFVYKKTSDFELTDFEYVADYYHELYPDADELFSNRILAACGYAK